MRPTRRAVWLFLGVLAVRLLGGLPAHGEVVDYVSPPWPLLCDGTNCTLKSGQLFLPNGTVGAPAAAFTNSTSTGLAMLSVGYPSLVSSGAEVALFGTSFIRLASGTTLGWTAGGAPSAAANDTGLKRAGAAVVQVTDGSTGDGALYVSTLDARNSSTLFSRLATNSSGNLVVSMTEKAPGAATVALAGAGAGNLTAGAYTYKITLVTAGGETEGGTTSATVTVVDAGVNGQVALSAIPTGTSGIVTSRKIYRTVAGGAQHKFVATIADNTTTTYTDNVADAGLGANAPTTNSAIDARVTVANTGSVTHHAGQLSVPNGTAAAPSVAFTNSSSTGLAMVAGGYPSLVSSGAEVALFGASFIRLVGGTALGWTAGGAPSAAANDTVLSRAAAGHVKVTTDGTTFGTFSSGTLNQSGANGQSVGIQQLTELTTIAAAASTATGIQIPANAVVLGVDVRVTTVIPTAATFTVTGTTSATTFNTAAVSTAANSTDPGTAACPYKNGAAQTITITPNVQPADNTGRVRVTIHYYVVTPATS